jgi:hypothetical protein
LRVEKLEKLKGSKYVQIYKNIMNVFIYDASNIILKSGLDAISSFSDGKELEKMHKGLLHYSKVKPVNVKDERREIADRLIYDNRYTF